MRLIPNPARRPGVTLTEALIAVGIMSIGLLALMTFFPLAAVQMARSFKDDRTGTLAANADNLMRSLWREMWYDPTSTGALLPEKQVMNDEPALDALDDVWVDYLGPGSLVLAPNASPDYGLTPPYAPGPKYLDSTSRNAPTNYTNWFDNAYPNAVRGNTFWPSFPVLIDPIGYRVRAGEATRGQQWVGYSDSLVDTGAQQYFIPRRTLGKPLGRTLDATSIAGASRYATLLDDITFGENGVPETNPVERAGKYNCAWMIQRNRNNTRLSIDITVLTFQGRPNSDIAGQERSARITNGNAAGSTSLDVYYGGGGATLPVHRGDWIIVVNLSHPRDDQFPDVPDSRRFLSFHRVLSVVENGTNNYTVELQQPIPAMPKRPLQPGETVPQAVVQQPTHIVMMEGLVEVFEAGRITLKTPPKP